MAAIARGEQRRALLIAGGGFVLVLALFLGSRVLGGGGGGGDDSSSDSTVPNSIPQTTPTVPPGGATPSEEVPVIAIPPVPDVLETLELRDPFTPPLAAIEFLRSLLPADPSQPTPTTPGPSPSPTAASVQLRAIDVVDGNEVATIDVDGTLFDAAEGDRFGPNSEFSVVTLDQAAQCGTFLFGDEAFSLCVGQAPQSPPAPGTTPQK